MAGDHEPDPALTDWREALALLLSALALLAREALGYLREERAAAKLDRRERSEEHERRMSALGQRRGR